MKKVFLLFTSLMIAFLSISCSSVPKKAAADKPLVIGVMSIYFPEKDSYQGDFDTAVKGAVKNNIEVSVEDVKTKKVYTTNTNPSTGTTYFIPFQTANAASNNRSLLVNDGIRSKIHMMPDKAKLKLQESLQKIVNSGSGGLIAIIL